MTTKKLMKQNKRKAANIVRTEKCRNMSEPEKANVVELEGESDVDNSENDSDSHKRDKKSTCM